MILLLYIYTEASLEQKCKIPWPDQYINPFSSFILLIIPYLFEKLLIIYNSGAYKTDTSEQLMAEVCLRVACFLKLLLLNANNQKNQSGYEI